MYLLKENTPANLMQLHKNNITYINSLINITIQYDNSNAANFGTRYNIWTRFSYYNS